MLFLFTWKFPNETFSFGCTAFSLMDDAARKQDAGNCKLLGRWHNHASKTGSLVMDAPSAEDVLKFCFNWSEDLADITVRPVVDDNEMREIFLGHEPGFKVDFNKNIGMEAPEGHSLFMLEGTLYADKKDAFKELWSSMTEEMYEADKPKKIEWLCSFMDIGAGTAFVVVAAPNENGGYLLQKWMCNWMTLFDTRIEPVVTDAVSVKLIKSKKGYAKKVEQVTKKLAEMDA
jgi:hypothetical protein